MNGADLSGHGRCALPLQEFEGGRCRLRPDARRQQSGEIDRMGHISKCGDAMMREMLFEAALVLMTHSRKWSWLKAWGMKIARHRGMKRAIVAVARRLAVIMHRMWMDGTEFRWSREEAAAA